MTQQEYTELTETLLSVGAEMETEGYTDFEQPEVMGFIDEGFNQVWEDR